MMCNNKFNISLLSGLIRIFTPTSKRLTSLFYQEKKKVNKPMLRLST